MFMCPCTCLNTSTPVVLYSLQFIHHLVEPIPTIKIFLQKSLNVGMFFTVTGIIQNYEKTVLKPGENLLNFLFCLNITNYVCHVLI